MMNILQHDMLVYFRKDAPSSRMYPTFKGKYTQSELTRTLSALRTLGLIVRTNPRGPKAATFCISRKGRAYLEAEYGVVLEHPDGNLEVRS